MKEKARNEKALGKMATKLGTPVCTDGMTCERKKLFYARIMVYVDASKPLKEEMFLTLPTGERIVQKVEYEYTPRYCHICKTLTHDTDVCRKAKKATTTIPMHHNDPVTDHSKGKKF